MYIQIMKAEIDLCICKLTGGLWRWPVDFKNFYFFVAKSNATTRFYKLIWALYVHTI